MIARVAGLLRSFRTIGIRMTAAEERIDEQTRTIERLRTDLSSQEEQNQSLALMTQEAIGRRLTAEIYGARLFAFNHTNAAIEVADGSARAANLEHTDAAIAAAIDALGAATREHAEALSEQTRHISAREIATIRRDLATIGRSQKASSSNLGVPVGSIPVESVPVESAPVESAPTNPQPVVDDAFYVALEDRFRGDQATIETRQELYVPYVVDLVTADFPLLDLGHGRGEWLRVLKRRDIPAVGVDSNPAFSAEAADAGLSVELGDLVQYLRDARDSSFGAITLFQVVEHLPFPVLVEVLSECLRVLRDGGVLIAETPNAMNLRVASSTFWIDPTHQRPLHPELLQFMAKYVGFSRAEGLTANELRPRSDEFADDAAGNAIRELLAMIDGPGDFSLLAWK